MYSVSRLEAGTTDRMCVGHLHTYMYDPFQQGKKVNQAEKQ